MCYIRVIVPVIFIESTEDIKQCIEMKKIFFFLDDVTCYCIWSIIVLLYNNQGDNDEYDVDV